MTNCLASIDWRHFGLRESSSTRATPTVADALRFFSVETTFFDPPTRRASHDTLASIGTVHDQVGEHHVTPEADVLFARCWY